MKFSKSSNTLLSVIMIIGVIAFSIITYFVIAKSMRTVYTNAMKDMVEIAIDNIQEQIQQQINECNFIIKTSSFMNYIKLCEDNKQNTPEALNEYTQLFNYINTKVQYTKSIDKIFYADISNKILISNNPLEVNSYLDMNSYYLESVAFNTLDVSICKNNVDRDIILITQPVRLYDETVGYLFIETNFTLIDSIMKSYKFGKDGNLFLIDSNLNFKGSNPSLLPKSLSDIKDSNTINALLHSKSNSKMRVYESEFKTETDDRLIIFANLKNIDCVIASSVSKSEVYKIALSTAFPMISLIIIIFLMLLLYRYIISRKILHPLALLSRSLYILKKGDLRARYNYNEDNEFGNLSCIFNQTISSLQNATLDLKEREEKNNIILKNVTDVIWEYNIEMDTVKMPENWSKLLGIDYDKASYLYTLEGLLDYVHYNDREDFKKCILNCIEKNERFYHDVKIKCFNDNYIWIRITGSCMYNIYNEPYQVIGSLFDITEDKIREISLKNSATRDDMTSLLKKLEMERLVDSDLIETKYEHFLAILDIDDFKSINDTHGHLVGDEVIIHVANVLKKICGDDCHLCRFGGDEFVIYTKIEYSMEKTRMLAADIVATLNTGHEMANGDILPIHCSIGIARSPKDGCDYVSLISKADLAIYMVKKSGKNGYTFYSK